MDLSSKNLSARSWNILSSGSSTNSENKDAQSFTSFDDICNLKSPDLNEQKCSKYNPDKLKLNSAWMDVRAKQNYIDLTHALQKDSMDNEFRTPSHVLYGNAQFLQSQSLLPTAQPIIITNNSKAGAQCEIIDCENSQSQKSTSDQIVEFLYHFWESRLNRVIFFGIIGSTLYFIWDWSKYKQRTAMLRRRIQSNLLFRISDFIATAAERRHRK